MSRYSPSQKHRNKKVIIFDFDGVLADSFNTFYSLIRASFKHIGFTLTPGQYRSFFIGNIHQEFKDFINDKNKYLTFSEFRKKNYDKYYFDKNDGVGLFPGAAGFIKNLDTGNILTIASSGKKNNIRKLLRKNGLKNYFNLILADSTYSKKNMIEEILNKFNALPQKTILVTDTVGDINVAKKIGLKTIAVTWGFHSAKLLKSAKPDCLANSFNILYKQLKAF